MEIVYFLLFGLFVGGIINMFRMSSEVDKLARLEEEREKEQALLKQLRDGTVRTAVYSEKANLYSCPHGYKNSDDCPDCRH